MLGFVATWQLFYINLGSGWSYDFDKHAQVYIVIKVHIVPLGMV